MTENFQEVLQRFYAENDVDTTRGASRAEASLPKLRLERVGKYTYLEGLDVLARHTRRPIDYVKEMFVSTTKCVLKDAPGLRQMIRGQLAKKTLRQFEKIYLERLLCSNCKSPETVITDGGSSCLNCGKTYSLTHN